MLESREYLSYGEKIATDYCTYISEKVLNRFDVLGLPSHMLHFEEKIPVMLTRNSNRNKNFSMEQDS